MKRQVPLFITLLIAFLIVSTQAVYANSGIFNSFVVVDNDGGGNVFYDIDSSTVNPDFQGTDFGTFGCGQTLVIAGGELKTFEDGGSEVTAASIYYRVTKQGDSSGGYTEIALANPGGKVGNDRVWTKTDNTTNLLAGLGPGTYDFEVFGDADANPEGTHMTSTRTATFTVVARSKNSGNWSVGTVWEGDAVPSANADVEICSGDAVTLNTNPTVDSLKINLGGTFNGGNSTNTLTINDNGTLTNNGTFTSNTETVAFAGTGSVSGSATFNNVDLITSLSAKGVDFGDSSTVNGTLAINTFRFVDGNAPTYNPGSTLKYSTGGSFNRGDEWKFSGAGIPHNVQITGNTALNMDVSGSGDSRTANGNVIIDSGSELQAPDGSLSVKGDFTNSGTFTHNEGKIVFSNSGNTLNIVNGSSLTFYDLQITGGTTLDAGSATFSINNNLTTTGIFNGNTSTIAFSGSLAQTIDGSGTAVFNNLTLNNSSGLLLNGDFNVEGVMTLTDGRFDLADHYLTLGAVASVAGSPDASKMVVAECTGTTGEGELRKEYAAAGSFTFPIGDNDGTAEYSPVTLNFSSGTFDPDAYVSICVVNAKQPDNTSSTDYLNRYWTVEQIGISSFTATPTFNYVQADVAGTEANIYGAKYDGSWSLLNQVDENNNQFNGAVTGFSDFTGGEQAVLPVTLSFFAAEKDSDQVRFTWQTATETGNMGFNLYVEGKDGLQQINKDLILSPESSSLRASDYSFSAVVSGNIFYIEDIDIFGKSKRRGPFALSQAYGRKVVETPIDWATINAEHEVKAAARNGAVSSSGPLLTLGVEQSGLYRLTHSDLLAAGLDLSGVNLDDIALTQGSNPMPITVTGSSDIFDSNSSIEFYGQAIDTLYSKENIYTLHIDAALATRVAEDSSAPSGSPINHYLETISLGDENKYDVVSHGDSPWYDSRLVAYNNPTSKSFTITVDNYVPGAASVSLKAELLGLSDQPETPDHHALVEFGTTAVSDITFDGLETYTVETILAEGLLQEGSNTLTISLPDDTGALFDVVGVDSYGVTYPRGFIAKADGQLTFTATGIAFQVDSLPGADVLVYRYDTDSSLTQLTNVAVSGSAGNYSATFAGSGVEATYLVYSTEHLLTPALRATRPTTDITTGTADYLMISHADFIDGLAPLVAYHENNGLNVKVVDVADVYDQFSDGIFDPQAIKDYIQYAAANMDIEYVLLVGGDTYDYADNLGLGSISFIPSPYMSTGSVVNFAPVDPLFVDVDGDLAPDLKLGRFPVRTSAELAEMIDKTLLYADADYKETAVFSADIMSERSYTSMSNDFASYLPDNWQVETAYLDEMSVEDARTVLIDSINAGVGLTSYVGHSGPSLWTWQGLFNADDAGSLTNVGQPTAVAQWGCWNTYHSRPEYDTLAHEFMQGESGAAIVLGATTLTDAAHEELLGQAFMSYLAQGNMSFGAALQLAKGDLESDVPGLLDVQLGYSLLGDPALSMVETSNCAPAPTPTNVTIEQNNDNMTLSWDDMGTSADHYEVWQNSPDNFYFTPVGSCAASADCTEVDGTTLELGTVTANTAYMVVTVNSCGQQSPLASVQRVGIFNFDIQPGVTR